MSHSNHLVFEKRARYFSLGNKKAKHLLYVLHGYGQLASRFILKFQELQDDYYIIAPEGMHRFYLEGHSGKVGASWMTKEDRLNDIANYLTYLNALHLSAASDHHQEISVLGFSQGVATAFRWIADGKIKPHRFIIASGMIPPDVSTEAHSSLFTGLELSYITGDSDPFRNEEEVKAFLKQFKDWGIPLKQKVFNGGHRIDLSSVKSLL